MSIRERVRGILVGVIMEVTKWHGVHCAVTGKVKWCRLARRKKKREGWSVVETGDINSSTMGNTTHHAHFNCGEFDKLKFNFTIMSGNLINKKIKKKYLLNLHKIFMSCII